MGDSTQVCLVRHEAGQEHCTCPDWEHRQSTVNAPCSMGLEVPLVVVELCAGYAMPPTGLADLVEGFGQFQDTQPLPRHLLMGVREIASFDHLLDCSRSAKREAWAYTLVVFVLHFISIIDNRNDVGLPPTTRAGHQLFHGRLRVLTSKPGRILLISLIRLQLPSDDPGRPLPAGR